MKKLLIVALFFATISGSLQAAVSQKNKDVVGEWKYEVPTAPYGYEKGVLVITEKEGQLAGEVKFADGYKIELKNLNSAGNVFKCGLYIDYDYISITANIEGKKMNGTVKTPEGDMKLTAEKVK
jgi:hypothetical protein